MSTPSPYSNTYKYFNFDLNDPGIVVILNRGTKFEKDITNNVRTAQTSNSVESIAGSFSMTVDNTDDAYVDRFGFCYIKVMSSIEIYAKSLSLNNVDSSPMNNFDSTQIPASAQNLNQFIDLYYNYPDDVTKSGYIRQIKALNSGRQSALNSGKPILDPIVDSDFILRADVIGQQRMNVLRQSPIRVPQQSSLYQRIFLGIVLNVSQNISPGGELSISLTGKSVGYWLESTPLNIRPGLYEVALNNIDLTAYSNRYATSNAMDIFRDLIRFSTDDLVAVSDFSTDTYGTAQTALQLNGTLTSNILDAYGNPQMQIDDDGNSTGANASYVTTKPTSQMNELTSLQERAYEGFPVNYSGDGPTSDFITGDSKWTELSTKYVADKAQLEAVKSGSKQQIDRLGSQIKTLSDQDPSQLEARNILATKLQQTVVQSNYQIAALQTAVEMDRAQLEGNSTFHQQILAITQNMATLQQNTTNLLKSGRTNILNQVGIIEHWKNIFSQMILEVVDNNNFLGMVYPLKIALTQPDPSLDGDYISKADLANMVAQNLMYEFYVDTNGHFILKPPLYNIGIQIDDPTYVIEESDIFSMSLNESTEGIITRIGVTGDYNYPVTLEKLQIYNIHQDMNLIRDYGFHTQEIANRMFLHNNNDCRDFGKSYMTKNNMELNSGNVTINGRPDIRLGTTVYLKPRDTMYYIKEINHEITAGGQYQTTLTLVGARRIITGFKAQSNLTTITEIVNAPKTPANPQTQAKTTPTIHYILSSAVNQDAITDQVVKTGPVLFDREQAQSLDQLNELALNPQTALLLGKSIAPNDTVNQKAVANGYTPQILRNVYQITGNINPALIGLIVDQNSDAISAINVANYNQFRHLTVDSIGNSLTYLQIPERNQAPAVQFIVDQFLIFVDTNHINTPQAFTVSLRDQWILYFLKTTSAAVTAATTPNGNGNVTVSAEATKAATAATIFNQIVGQLDNGGAYRQYTDSDGRELPSYFDYGKSLLIENNQLTVAQFTQFNDITDQQKQDQASRTKATQAYRNKPQSHNAIALNQAVLDHIAAIQKGPSVAPTATPSNTLSTNSNQDPTAVSAQQSIGQQPSPTPPPSTPSSTH